MPRRLGLIYCQQRPSQIYASSVTNLLASLENAQTDAESYTDNDAVNLTPDYFIARSPQFSPLDNDRNCHRLVYMSSKEGFNTHMGCVQLCTMDWYGHEPDIGSNKVAIDVVKSPRDSPTEWGVVAGNNFPGMFLLSLSNGLFASSDQLLVTTVWGSTSKVVKVNLAESQVELVQFSDSILSSEQLLSLSAKGDAIAVSKQADLETKILCKNILDVSSKSSELATPSPIACSTFSAISYPDQNFSCEIVSLDSNPLVEGVDVDVAVQSILLLPKNTSKGPPALIVVPHGGPHSSFTTAYIPGYAYLCGSGGYAILMVNYRGGIGYGRDFVESLPTRIGTLDVADVIAATQHVCKSGLVDSSRVGICGGSHGGFLTGHCTGQYPDLFKAAVMRNPVVNLASMITSTDIPDWCYVEGVGAYDWTQYKVPTAETLSAMYAKSPIRYLNKVKTPTLIALGMCDRRVPPSQGLEWHHVLRSAGVCTELLVYENDNHAIAGIASSCDHWINIKRWFDRYL